MRQLLCTAAVAAHACKHHLGKGSEDANSDTAGVHLFPATGMTHAANAPHTEASLFNP